MEMMLMDASELYRKVDEARYQVDMKATIDKINAYIEEVLKDATISFDANRRNYYSILSMCVDLPKDTHPRVLKELENKGYKVKREIDVVSVTIPRGEP